jgi:O-methyltransferase
MASKFGFLSKVNVLQNMISYLIAKVNPAIIHNIEKYYIIKKVHYLSAIEEVNGDYLEFGVFTGSSFCHSIRCCYFTQNLNSNVKETKFYGFDSFAGFGNIEENEKHPFYTDTNFDTNYDKVNRRVNKISGNFSFKLIKGFFNETLKNGADSFGIKYSRIIFIDSDTYSSANEALTFCIPTIQEGTYLILDDFFSYKGNSEKGVAKAFNEFLVNTHCEVREVFTYGMGGKVFVISKMELIN